MGITVVNSAETGAARGKPGSRGPVGLYITFLLIGACAAAAALLTAFGAFSWGLPNDAHIGSYHPDEQNITYSLRNMRPAQHDLNPHFWGNPTFYTYQVGALALLASKVGVLPPRMDAGYWLTHPDAVRTFYVIGRELSVAYAVLSMVLVFYVTRRITGDKYASAVASLMFVALPVTAVHAHYMTVNASAVFWSLTAMLFALRIQDKPSWANYVFAGIFAGFAISTKFNNAFLPFAILTAHVVALAPLGWRRVLLSGRLMAAAVACGLAFFAGSPYYVLAHSEVTADPHSRMNMAALFDFSQPIDRVLYHFWNHWTASCGWVLAGVFLAVVPLAFVFGPRRRLLPVYAVVVPFLALAVKSGWWAFPSRIWPLLALLSILTAVLLFERRWSFIAGLLVPATVLGLVVTIPWNMAYYNLTQGAHIRAESSAWIETNVHPDSGIIVLDTPYYESPNIVYQNAVHPECVTGTRYDIVNLGGDFDALKAAVGQWLVIPQGYEEKLRAKTGMGIVQYAEKNGFGLVTRFNRDFEAFGVELRSWAPADMVQSDPVYIFARLKPKLHQEPPTEASAMDVPPEVPADQPPHEDIDVPGEE